jgi:hypothetical protein
MILKCSTMPKALKGNNNHYIIRIISLLLGLLFIYSAIHKISDFTLFREQLLTSPILEPIWPIPAFLLPLTELAAGSLLAVPKYRLIGLYLSLWLLMTFIVYLNFITVINVAIPCSCGGALESLTLKQHIGLNILCMSIACYGIVLEKLKRKVEINNSKYHTL